MLEYAYIFQTERVIMSALLPFNSALDEMLQTVQNKDANLCEFISVDKAQNRICAEDIISAVNVPTFNNSKMDGYAIRLQDFENTLTLPQANKILAGQPFNGNWPSGSVIKVATGAMLPIDTDAVVMQENTKINPNGSITLLKMPVAGENIRYIGEDIKKDKLVLAKGSVLNSVTLPLLASLGINNIKVFNKLKVAVISTGNELVAVGNPLSEGKIYDTNRLAIKLMLGKMGCKIIDFGLSGDDENNLQKMLLNAQEQADLIITTGGVSVGEADLTKKVLAEIGRVSFWKVAIKPGKPFAFGRIKNAYFCGLPGNPVSALVTFYQLVQPLIEKLKGHSQWRLPAQLQAIAKTDFNKLAGRLDFQRGIYHINANGQLEVEPAGGQDSHIFSSFVTGNCFVILEQHRGNVMRGESVTIEPFNHLLA